MTSRSTAVVVGLAADRLLGEPAASWHPVAGYGRAMQSVEGRVYADRRGAGLAYAALGVGSAAAAGRALGRPASREGWALLSAATYLAVAGKALGAAATSVAAPLNAGDLAAARLVLPALVGRDPADLDASNIARAVVESVAENTVDAIVAPAFWAAVGGAPGALGYRALNTLDSMVGHRSPRYSRFGWASARGDDVAAWIPARLTAVLVAGVRPASAAQVWRAVRTQAPSHPSPNAGVAEAAFAAALGLRLGGTNRYGGRTEDRPALGDGRPAGVADIDRARVLSRDVTIALALLALVPSLPGACKLGSRLRATKARK